MFYGGLNMLSPSTMPIFGADLVGSIVSAVSDVALILDDQGIILGFSARKEHQSLSAIAKALNTPAKNVLTTESYEKLSDRMAALRASAAKGDRAAHLWCDLVHEIGDGQVAPVRYSIHLLPEGNRFLMMGEDQRPVIELQQQLVSAQIAMERDYEIRREADSRLRMVMEATRDPILFVSVSTRRIVDINAAAAELLGATRIQLNGQELGHEFESSTPGEVIEAAMAVGAADKPTPIEVRSRRTQKALRLHARLFRAAGERLLILRVDSAQDGNTTLADPLGDNLRQLYARGVDGIVFTDKDGIIVSANEAFLNLTDSPMLSSVKGRSLADFLVRGVIDLKVMLENARRAGHLRVYATRLRTDYNGELPVEVSATWISEGAQPMLSLIIRDSSRSEALRASMGATEPGMASVMEMIGTAPLKEIVAETTNIIERMCIENAVELTRNNRVAAAEMLGLSRQSLYVKLRKYGLLARDEE